MTLSCLLLSRKDFATSCARQAWVASCIEWKAEGMVSGDGKLPGSPITKRPWFGGSSKFSCSGNRIRERQFFRQLLRRRVAFRADALFSAPPLANHLPLREGRPAICLLRRGRLSTTIGSCFFVSASLQLRVLRLSLLQDGDIGIGIFPEGEEIFVGGERPGAGEVGICSLRGSCLQGIGTGHSQMCQRSRPA